MRLTESFSKDTVFWSRETSFFTSACVWEPDIARRIERALPPQRVTPTIDLDVRSFSQPARGVGGDYHDVIPLPSGNLGIAIGDVSGKGISAALLMADIQVSLRKYSEDIYSPKEVMSRINNWLCSVLGSPSVEETEYQYTEEHRFATLLYGVLDPGTGSFTYSNAGHHYPLLFRGSRTVECGRSRAAESGREGGDGNVCEWLESTGLPCGIMEDALYDEERVELGVDDIALFYTDGVTEAMDSDEAMFGEERLRDTVLRSLQWDPANLVADIRRSLAMFVGDAPQHDDLTIMAIKMQKSVEPTDGHETHGQEITSRVAECEEFRRREESVL
jgi:sigma-B regulation protein RsbU (phosphoserine phosphatase)